MIIHVTRSSVWTITSLIYEIQIYKLLDKVSLKVIVALNQRIVKEVESNSS